MIKPLVKMLPKLVTKACARAPFFWIRATERIDRCQNLTLFTSCQLLAVLSKDITVYRTVLVVLNNKMQKLPILIMIIIKKRDYKQMRLHIPDCDRSRHHVVKSLAEPWSYQKRFPSSQTYSPIYWRPNFTKSYSGWFRILVVLFAPWSSYRERSPSRFVQTLTADHDHVSCFYSVSSEISVKFCAKRREGHVNTGRRDWLSIRPVRRPSEWWI